MQKEAVVVGAWDERENEPPRGGPRRKSRSSWLGLRRRRYRQQAPDLLDPPTVDPQIPVARPRGRAHLDEASRLVDEKLGIVDEAEKRRSELHVQVDPLLLHDLGPRQGADDAEQFAPRLRCRTAEGDRLDRVARIGAQRRDAVGRIGAGREPGGCAALVPGPAAVSQTRIENLPGGLMAFSPAALWRPQKLFHLMFELAALHVHFAQAGLL